MALELRGPSTAALSASFAARQTERAWHEKGVQVDDCSSAAAWSKFTLSSQAVAANATPDPVRGHYLTFTTGTTAANGRNMRDCSLDLRGKFLTMWVRPKDANLAGLEICVNRTDDTANITSTVGGTGVDNILTANTWYLYTFDPADARHSGTPAATPESFANITGLGVRVRNDAGVSAQVDVADIRIHDKGSFTGGHVVFMFDDAKIATWDRAYPILDAAGYVGSVPVEYGNVGAGTHMSVSQLQTLHGEGWEFTGHYPSDMSALSDSAAETIFKASRNFLRTNGLQRGASYWVWPGGLWTANLENIALRYYHHLRRIVGGARTHTPPWVCDRRLMPLAYVTAAVTPATVKGYLDSAANYDGTVVLVFHDILASGATGANYNQADFQEVVTYAQSLGIRSTTLTDLFGE